MQLDRRARYALPSGSRINTSYVRQLRTARSFFQASDEELTRNYASAKAEIAQWLLDVDPKSLYTRLERVANGEKLETVLSK